VERTIGILNTNFGFGPVSKANYLIEALKKRNASIRYFGSGGSLEFIVQNQKNIKISTIQTDNLTQEDLEQLYEMDLIINVMNTDFLAKYDPDRVMSVFVDSLAWMWEDHLPGIEKVKRHYVQDYLLEYSKQKLNDAKIVSPITNLDTGWSLKRGGTLINFSGMMNPFSDEAFFLDYMIFNLRILLAIIPKEEEIFVSVNEVYISHLRKQFAEYENLHINFYIHKDFRMLLKQIKTIYTTSGITMLLEIYSSNITVRLLLPSNYSQYLMNEIYNDNKLFGGNITLSHFGYTDKPASEEAGVVFVKSALKEIMQSKQDTVKEWYIHHEKEEQIQNRKPFSHPLGQAQIVDDVMDNVLINLNR